MLEWEGELVAARAEHAMVDAMADVIDHECVPDAQIHTPVETGAAREGLRRFSEGGLAQTWGYDVDYGIFIEIGSTGHVAHHALRRAGDAHYGDVVPNAARRFDRG